MPQLTAETTDQTNGHAAWSHPTTKASAFDYIRTPGFPLLLVFARVNYVNGNVVLLTTRNINSGEGGRSLDRAFLLNSAGEVIAEPEFHHGDIVTTNGTYFSSTAPLTPGVSLAEVEAWQHRSLQKVWDIYINGQNTEETVWQTNELSCTCNGIRYRSAYQAANVAAEEWAIRQAAPELEAIF